MKQVKIHERNNHVPHKFQPEHKPPARGRASEPARPHWWSGLAEMAGRGMPQK